MKKLIHTGYFKEVFRQLKVAGLVSAGILMIGNISMLLSYSTNTYTVGMIPGAMTIGSSMMAFVYIMGLVLTLMAFGWLNKRSTSDFYHSIPITRTQQYFSTVAAILLWMFIGVTAYALVNVLIYVITDSPCNYLLYLGVYVNMLIGAIEVVGAVSLACAISGTRFVNLVAACIILFLPRFLLTVLSIFIVNTPGGDGLYPASICWLFDPNYNLFGSPFGLITNELGMGGTYSFAKIPAMIYSFVYSAGLVVLGWLLFKKRKSEAAGIPTTNKVFQTIIRVAFGLPLLLVLAYMIASRSYDFDELIVPGVLLILFAFVFYCLYELISTKSIKKMAKAMPMFLVCIGIGALYLLIPKLIVKAAHSVDLKPENIKSYQICNDDKGFIGDIFDSFISYNSYKNIMEPEIKYTDEQGIKVISDAFNRWKNSGESGGFTVKINRKFGAPIKLDLYLTPIEESKIENIQTSNPEYKKICTEIPEGKKYVYFENLPRSCAAEVEKTFIEEYNSLSEGDKAIVSFQNMGNGPSITMLGCKGAKNYSNAYQLNDRLPNTRKAFYKAMNEANAEKTMKTLSELSKITEETDESNEFDIAITGAAELSFSSWEYLYSDTSPEKKNEYMEVIRILASGTPNHEGAPQNTVMVSGYWFTDYRSNTIGMTAITLSDADIARLNEIAADLFAYDYADQVEYLE